MPVLVLLIVLEAFQIVSSVLETPALPVTADTLRQVEHAI